MPKQLNQDGLADEEREVSAGARLRSAAQGPHLRHITSAPTLRAEPVGPIVPPRGPMEVAVRDDHESPLGKHRSGNESRTTKFSGEGERGRIEPHGFEKAGLGQFGVLHLRCAEFELLPGKQHRFTLVLRGEGLGQRLNDNDPQVEGKAPLEIVGANPDSERTAAIVASFIDQARAILADEEAASGMLLRGFSKRPAIESYPERYGLRAAACAIYPMYRGIARLCGMDMLDPGNDLGEQIASVGRSFDDHDYFFIHTKEADQAGHNGDFDEKVSVLEAVDARIPELLDLGADVVLITGDHSTPTIHMEHSWHPVPLILASNRTISVEGTTFDERGVLRGDLGTVPGPDLMTLALAHAGRLAKFGA